MEMEIAREGREKEMGAWRWARVYAKVSEGNVIVFIDILFDIDLVTY